MAEQKIRAIMIVEIAGRPAPHIKQTLKQHVEQMENVKNTKIISIEVHDPREIENQKGIYTCFAEVEFECEGMSKLTEIVFDFMPSSVEILEPIDIKFNSQEATVLMNNLTGRLHRYDEIAKIAQLQNQQLVKKIQEMQAELEEKKEVKKAKPKKKEKKSKPIKKGKPKKK